MLFSPSFNFKYSSTRLSSFIFFQNSCALFRTTTSFPISSTISFNYMFILVLWVFMYNIFIRIFQNSTEKSSLFHINIFHKYIKCTYNLKNYFKTIVKFERDMIKNSTPPQLFLFRKIKRNKFEKGWSAHTWCTLILYLRVSCFVKYLIFLMIYIIYIYLLYTRIKRSYFGQRFQLCFRWNILVKVRVRCRNKV